MPNLQSSKKALRGSKRKAVYNKRKKNIMKQAVKNVRDLVASGQVNEAEKSVPEAYKAIDKAAKRGVIKKNTAARKKSRLVSAIKKAK